MVTLEGLIGLNCYCESFDKETSDVFLVKIFELDNKLFEESSIDKWYDDSLQMVVFVASTLYTGEVVFRISMAIRTNFRMWVQFSFAGFA